MLKPAQEINQIAHEASVRAMESERQKNEEQARKDAERDRNHAEFQRRALEEAKRGTRSVVVTDLRLNRSRLAEQGFEWTELTRRESFETSLRRDISDLESEITELAQQLMLQCPEVPEVKGDTFLHFNPLLSLLKTLQDRQPANPWAEVAFFTEHLRFSTEQGAQWLEKSTKKIGALLQLAERRHGACNKLESVTRENQHIPPGYETAIYVTWKHADLDVPWDTQFGARYLRWVSQSWEGMMIFLSEVIEDRAAKGLFKAKLRLTYNGPGWYAMWFDAEECYESDEMFGPPSFWASELEQLGYRSSIKQVRYDIDSEAEEMCAVDPEQLARPNSLDCYEVEIAWS